MFVTVGVAPRGTLNTQHMLTWINTVFRSQRGVFHARHLATLVLDSYGVHMADEVNDPVHTHTHTCPLQVVTALRKLNTTPVFVPKRCTSFLQPLDATVNAVYKRALERHWDQWMRNTPKQLTAQGNIRKPSNQCIVDMVSAALKDVRKDTVSAHR